MTIIHRRILYIIFFMIFFITAPLVIMWAQGYKFDWNNRSWEKTGVLFLEIKPKNVAIYLNNKFYKEGNSERIKNLLPGEYEIKIEKEGYIAWNKNLTIYPNTTTFAQYIRLFKNDLPTINLLNENILKYSEIIDDKIILATQEQDKIKLQLLDTKNIDSSNIEQVQEITNLNISPEDIFLSPTTEKILIKDKNSWLFIDIINKKTTNLSNFLNLEISQPIFDPNNSNIFYALSNKGLEKIDTLIPKITTLTTENIISFYISNNDLFYIKQSTENLELIKSSLNNPSNQEILSILPLSSSYKFYPAPNNIVNLIDTKNQILYIFDFETKIFPDKKTIIPEVKYLTWHPKIDSLIFANDYEIWTWQKRNNKYTKNLIVRLSTKIKDALWFTFDTHLLFLTEDSLYITEVVSDKNIIIKNNKIKNSRKAFLNKDGNLLFWLTENNIYQSEIQ